MCLDCSDSVAVITNPVIEGRSLRPTRHTAPTIPARDNSPDDTDNDVDIDTVARQTQQAPVDATEHRSPPAVPPFPCFPSRTASTVTQRYQQPFHQPPTSSLRLSVPRYVYTGQPPLSRLPAPRADTPVPSSPRLASCPTLRVSDCQRQCSQPLSSPAYRGSTRTMSR